MPTLLTLITCFVGYLSAVVIVMSKLGVGQGIFGWLLLSAVPYAILLLLAAAFRKRRKEGWFILVGTVVCVVIGVHGISAAFYSDRPHDPWIVMFRPIAQAGLAVVVALIAGLSYLVSRKSHQEEKQPIQLPETTRGK